MMEERSAGVLVFREAAERKFLLLHYPAGHWDYPKGHVENCESLRETALRELEEETGISPDEVELFDDFKEVIDYIYYKMGELSHKEVTYFLGRTDVDEVNISREHQDYMWLPYDEALKVLTFYNAKKIIRSAQEYLDENPGKL